MSIKSASTELPFVLLALFLLSACGGDGAPPAASAAAAAAPIVAAADDWCVPCKVPESMCTVCNPGLIEKYQAAGDWCPEHGFPESVCPTCNPVTPPDAESASAAPDWCLEHGLPESMCTKCQPRIAERFRAEGDFCEEHGFPASACPKCRPGGAFPAVEKAALEALVVRFRSPELEEHTGVGTVPARSAEATAGVECTARIAFDADRLADIRAIVPGIVRRVHAQLGARVERGAPLFELESTRIGEIQGELETARERVRTAEADLARQRELEERDIASARQVEVAEQELAAAKAALRAAEAALRMAGAEESAPSGRYTLRAPLAGSVVRRPAVVGLLASESTSLATIADTSTMWALCDVPEADAGRVELGQRVVVTLRGDTERRFEGELTFIAAEVDPRTRTVAARAELPNPEGRLRANQFARARIDTGIAVSRVSVPRAAVQRVGEHEVVFVRRERGVYEPRVVERHGDGELVQVAGRLTPGDQVVTTSAVLLRTEVMPNSIGAGCCEVAPRRRD
jgi:cobalt-zinc-cadmium efflux system membrane fusion protein